MKALGFSGTRKGMTTSQIQLVFALMGTWLNMHDGLIFRHGDCPDGADQQAAHLAMALGYHVIAHPGAPLSPGTGHLLLKVKPPLKRNEDIAELSTVLLATPGEKKEVLRSGTWATVRYARKLKKMIVLVYPDGSQIVEEP